MDPPPLRTAAWGLLVGSLAVLVSFLFLSDASLTYDEATYVDLGNHPWHSPFYPDQVFVRHPPLYFVFIGGWQAIGGHSAAWVRLPSMMFTLGSVALAWNAARRRPDASAGLAALVVGANFLAVVYGIQATMYPLATFFVALGAWASVAERPRLERAALVLASLTHLFGFVFLGLYAWRHRAAWKTTARFAWPAALWLVAAFVGAVAAGNRPGPGLGPGWQILRVFALPFEAVTQSGALLRHVYVAILAWLLIGPMQAWEHLRRWRRGTHWERGAAALAAFLWVGPAFLRYALLPLPVLQSGRMPRANGKSLALVVVSLAVVGNVAAGFYVTSSLDPGAPNDVPGLLDWRVAAHFVASRGPSLVGTQATTAMAYYLADQGYHVINSSGGPAELGLATPGGSRVVLKEAPDLARAQVLLRDGAMVTIPLQWQVRDAVFREGNSPCGTVQGLEFWVRGACPS